MHRTVSTLPNERTHSRNGFTLVAVTRSVLTVCVDTSTPEDEGSGDEDDDGLRDAEKGDDDTPAPVGKTVRPSFVRARSQNTQP